MDINRADLPLLASLDVLLDERNVTRAAARIGVSQPALSTQLARLRDLFDDPLLVASGRRMVTTPFADELRGPLRESLAGLDGLLTRARGFEPASSERVFRVGAPEFLHATVVAPAVDAVAREAPGVRIAMLPFADAWNALEADRLDLLVTSVGTTPREAVAVTLHEERFVMVQRRGHPRGDAAASLDEFCALPQLLVSLGGGGFEGPTDAALRRLGRRRDVVLSVTSFLLASTIVATSDIVAVLPRAVASLAAERLDALPLPFELDGFAVLASWHPKRRDDRGLRWLRERLRAASTDDDGRADGTA